MNRYIEFYDEYNRNNNVDGTLPDSIEQIAVEDFIKTYQKKNGQRKNSTIILSYVELQKEDTLVMFIIPLN